MRTVNSRCAASCPADPTSAAAGGIRFHRSAAVETRDAIQAFGAERELRAATATVLSWDYKGKRAVAASVPTAAGPLVATSGASEIHTDRLGRIRIRHDFQAEGEAGTWVRVMQRQAGAGMGAQFIPRLGQQVLVGFIEDDIDRPIVLGALYDGRGEAGTSVIIDHVSDRSNCSMG